MRLPFDPIARASELWRERWGEDSRSVSMATATSVMRVQQLLLGQFDAIAGRHGLTFARYEALVLLAFSREGRLSMSRIGERLMVHPTSATNIVQRLAAQGFVERVPNPADRRGAFAVITDAGREAMEAVTADLEAVDFGLPMLDDATSTRRCSPCCARCGSGPATSTPDRPFTDAVTRHPQRVAPPPPSPAHVACVTWYRAGICRHGVGFVMVEGSPEPGRASGTPRTQQGHPLTWPPS